MNREDIAALRKAFPQYLKCLDECEKKLEKGHYYDAISDVRRILKNEYTRAQEYARAGKIARDSALIQSTKEILLQFEKVEAAKAFKKLGGTVKKELFGAWRRNRMTSWVLKSLNPVLESQLGFKVPEKFIDYATTAATFCSGLVTNKDLRQQTIDAVKTWFWGGEKRKCVAEACAKIKEKTCGFWGWAKNAARGIFSRSENRQKLSAGH